MHCKQHVVWIIFENQEHTKDSENAYLVLSWLFMNSNLICKTAHASQRWLEQYSISKGAQ